MNRITPELLALAWEYSLAQDGEEIAWERHNRDGMAPYREAFRKAEKAMNDFYLAAQSAGLNVNQVLEYCRTFVGSPGIRLPDGREILWPTAK